MRLLTLAVSLAAVALCTSQAAAHFVWVDIVPTEKARRPKSGSRKRPRPECRTRRQDRQDQSLGARHRQRIEATWNWPSRKTKRRARWWPSSSKGLPEPRGRFRVWRFQTRRNRSACCTTTPSTSPAATQPIWQPSVEPRNSHWTSCRVSRATSSAWRSRGRVSRPSALR